MKCYNNSFSLRHWSVFFFFFSLLGDVIKATKLTAVAMKEADSDVIEVRLVSGHNGLEVLQNQKVLSFTEQSWMDLRGEIHLPAYEEATDFTFLDQIL